LDTYRTQGISDVDAEFLSQNKMTRKAKKHKEEDVFARCHGQFFFKENAVTCLPQYAMSIRPLNTGMRDKKVVWNLPHFHFCQKLLLPSFGNRNPGTSLHHDVASIITQVLL
jgi:hypothetical protein